MRINLKKGVLRLFVNIKKGILLITKGAEVVCNSNQMLVRSNSSCHCALSN